MPLIETHESKKRKGESRNEETIDLYSTCAVHGIGHDACGLCSVERTHWFGMGRRARRNSERVYRW